MQPSIIGVESGGNYIGADVASVLAKADNIIPVTDKEDAFSRLMWGTPFVHQIDFDHLKRLKEAFKRASAEDSYSISPTYYGLTGRRGLWIQHNESGDTAMIFCLHPNIDNTVLIFPPFGNRPQPLLTGFLEHIVTLGMNIKIGRVHEQNATTILEYACAARGLTASVVPETTLDWAYPVQTIATAALVAKSGGAYGKIRQAHNKFSKVHPVTGEHFAKVEDINFQQDKEALKKIAQDWEDNRTYYAQYTPSIPTDYFPTLLRIAQNKDIALQGKKVFVNGVLEGFSIWERPFNNRKTANLYASQVAKLNEHSHLGTFLIYETAKEILEQGGSYVCLGGSETATMDKYKRCFVPHTSTSLVTIDVTPA